MWAVPMRKLTVITGPASGRTVEVEGEVVIGRENADLTIPDSEISRRHAAVRPSGFGVEVEDLGSRNGTLVNGERIGDPVTLTQSGTISLGPSEIRVELAPEASTRVTSPPAAETSPAPEAAPTTSSGKTPSRRSVVAIAALCGAAAVAVLLVLVLGDDDDSAKETKRRAISGRGVTAVVTKPGLRMTVAGFIQASPIGRSGVLIERRIPQQPLPGGAAVPLDLRLAIAPAAGSIDAKFTGTIRVTRTGTEIVRGRARVTKGGGEYQGATGSFAIRGDNPPRTTISRFVLDGTIEY